MERAHWFVRIVGIPAVAASLALVAAAPARADHLTFEAEDSDELEAPSPAMRTITSPMRIVDRADASGGSSIEVQNGLDSKTSVPTLGRACYKFTIDTAGSYRVWVRVIARTDEDDSFWVRMDNGSWIKWNEIALGANWHWDFVHNDVTPTQPSTFSLATGNHTLCVAYREDDTRLDLLVVTSDTAFDPRAAITGPPQSSEAVSIADGVLALRVEWMTVRGATSYTVERRVGFDPEAPWVPQAATTGHTFTQTGLTDLEVYCYRVIATGPTGSSPPTENFPCRSVRTGIGAFSFASDVSLTSPLHFVTTPRGETGFAVTAGNNSLGSPPASGWARFDFKIASAVTMKAHAQVSAPNPDSDSFWVRMDGGTWVKWNNIVPDITTCDYDNVHNSDAGGASVNYNLGAGSHFIEFAYREEGTAISKIFLTTSTETEGVGLCFD
jgi:hypothetical protein